MKVRQVDASDLQLLDRAVKQAIGRTMQMELDAQANGEHSLFIAAEADEIFGWGFIRWLGPRDREARRLFPQAPEIYRLEVRESNRSSGLGSALIEEMAEQAAARGYPAVSLGVGHDNPRAYSLYRRLGFEDTELNEYIDEYQYPLPGGGFGTARDLCRYLIRYL